MSLYHETADILSAPANANGGGGLKNRVFAKKGLKSPAAQVFALAAETCKWSEVLKEVVEQSGLLKHERKVCIRFVVPFFLHFCRRLPADEGMLSREASSCFRISRLTEFSFYRLFNSHHALSLSVCVCVFPFARNVHALEEQQY